MPKYVTALMFLLAAGIVVGKENKSFQLEQVVNPRVAKMAVPKLQPEMVGVQMSVSSPSAKARAHVKQGFALIHAQWDFEAYRHFCAALVEDPDCMLAYCGVTLAIVKPHGEYVTHRNAAVSRMLDLIQADDAAIEKGKPARFPKLEKQFAYAIANLVSRGAQTSGAMMKSIAAEYPKALQAHLLGAYLTRGSYDVAGNASKQRTEAIELMRRLMDKYPDNPMILGFWLSIHAEAPSDIVPLKTEVLPYARRLVKLCPNVPSWQHALGHFEWRAGNFLLAERAFTKAAELYQQWMQAEQISLNDCEGYVRAKCYLANTLYHRGDFAGAMKIAQEIRSFKADPDRPISEGSQILLWRAYTLPARLYIARAAEGDMNLALKSFPSEKELAPFLKHPKFPTLAGGYMDALKTYIGCRKALEKKDLIAAKSLHKKSFRGFVAQIAEVFPGAKKSAEFSHYYRAAGSLAVHDMELYGLISMNEENKMPFKTANDFRSAREKQITPSMMQPPLAIMHMDNRLAAYYLSTGEHKEAFGAYQDALQKYPNNMDSLHGIKRCYEAMGQKQHAEQIQNHIDAISPKSD